MTPRPAQPDEQVVRQAIAWMLRLRGQPDTGALQACENWRNQHASHELAWQRVQQLDQELGVGLRALPQSRQVLEDARAGLRRRQALKLLSGAAVGGAALWLSRDLTPWERLTADLATATGERHGQRLADGSRLLLNTDSAVDLRMTAGQRQVHLRRGEILLEAAPQAEALHLRSAQGWLRTRAARFVARLDAGALRLCVLGGEVEVLHGGTGGRTVGAGRTVEVRAGEVRELPPPAMEPGAWADGLIVTRDVRLGDFVAEVARYRPGRLACSEAVADLRLSGVYRLDDTERLLALLPQTLPVQLRYRTRWWVTVEARA